MTGSGRAPRRSAIVTPRLPGCADVARRSGDGGGLNISLCAVQKSVRRAQRMNVSKSWTLLRDLAIPENNGTDDGVAVKRLLSAAGSIGVPFLPMARCR
jgi:hypothetical protein